jgi:glutathione peroxidase
MHVMRWAMVCLLGLSTAGCTASTTPQTGADAGDSDTGTTDPPKKDAGNTFADSGVMQMTCDPPPQPTEIYNLGAMNLAGTEKISMCNYRGKVMLIVNVASKCGYTPQYAGLQTNWDKYSKQGFVTLGFPCNQFGAQEPGTGEDISEFCTTMYGITFPMFAKIDVNGANTDPIYVWLKAQPGGAGNISWNFNKFLVGRDGKLIKRYSETVTPQDPGLIADIEAALAK